MHCMIGFTSAVAWPFSALCKLLKSEVEAVKSTVVAVGPPEDHGQFHGVCADIGMHTVLAGEVLRVCSHMVADSLVHAIEHFRGDANVNKNLRCMEVISVMEVISGFPCII